MVAAVSFRSTGSGEVGEIIWRRGSRSFTGTVFPSAEETVLGLASVIGKKARVLLGFQQFRFTKRGTQGFEGSSRRPESDN